MSQFFATIARHHVDGSNAVAAAADDDDDDDGDDDDDDYYATERRTTTTGTTTSMRAKVHPLARHFAHPNAWGEVFWRGGLPTRNTSP